MNDSSTYRYHEEEFDMFLDNAQNGDTVNLLFNSRYKLLGSDDLKEVTLIAPSGRCAIAVVDRNRNRNCNAAAAIDLFRESDYYGGAGCSKVPCKLFRSFNNLKEMYEFIDINNINTKLSGHRHTIRNSRGPIYYA